MLLDIRNLAADDVDVSSEVSAVGSGIFVGTGWKQSVIAAVAVIEVYEFHIGRVRREEISGRPFGGRVVRRKGNDRVLAEKIRPEAIVERRDRHAVICAVCRAAR